MISIFETATGRILRNVSCPREAIDIQIGPGEGYVEGDFSSEDFYVLDGVAIPIPANTGGIFHKFDYATRQWYDPRTLEQVKQAKNGAINAARLRANTSFFVFRGKQIAVDPLSRSDIDAAHGAFLLAGGPPPGWPGRWKAIDNTFVDIPDLATWAQFYGTMVATGTANFQRSQALKAQLDAATTIAEVEAIPDW